MASCVKCESRLGEEVAFCPFCGSATGEPAVTEPVVAVAAATAVPAAVEPSSPPAPEREVVEARTAPAKSRRKAAEKPEEAVVAPARSRKDAAVKSQPAAAIEPPSAPPSAPPQRQSQQPPKKSHKVRNFVVLAIVAMGVYAYANRGPSQSALECQSAVDQAGRSLKNGDLTAARMELARGDLACEGAHNADARAAIRKVIDQQDARAQRECNVATRPIVAMLSGHRMTSASNALDRLSPACAEMDVATELRQQLARSMAVAAATNEKLEAALVQSNTAAMRQLIGDLEKADTENIQLPKWRAEVARLEAAQSQAAAAQVPAPANELRTTPYGQQAPSMINGPSAGALAQNAQNEVARQFLSEAEAALSQKRFDAARTFAESARRLDPSNPRVRTLMRAIQERERQVLQDETTIN